MPARIREATQEYFEDQDPVGQWVEEGVVVTGREADFVSSADLLDAFHGWCMENHYEQGLRLNQSSFGTQLKRVLEQGVSGKRAWRVRSSDPATRKTGWKGVICRDAGGRLTHLGEK